MIVDDVDAREGSATSLLRTIIGSYIRGLGGWMSVAEMVRLMDAVGISDSHARTAVLRIKNKGLLLAEKREGHQGYRLHPDAVSMLERGDRRIFTFRQQRDGGPWCLLSFSLPETERAARHQLRKRLAWIGCGTVATGLWICPAFLTDEVEEILIDLDVRHWATVFITDTPHPAGSLSLAVREWWDLDVIIALHQRFIDKCSTWGPIADPREAFARYVMMLDSWRRIPYLDPGLQPSVLPNGWPGFDSVGLFDRLRYELGPTADRFVRNEWAASALP
ncbi:MAG: PaaX family transcriptional regulator C-terminal domain-containing protein [Terrimesophilobacter sp.]